ncbi:hypothetical protein ACJX0J_022261, partial [Zea mays]
TDRSTNERLPGRPSKPVDWFCHVGLLPVAVQHHRLHMVSLQPSPFKPGSLVAWPEKSLLAAVAGAEERESLTLTCARYNREYRHPCCTH